MGLETGTYIDDLVITNPVSSDKRRFGDDHLRLIKTCLKNSFPNIDGPVNGTPTELNYVVGVTSLIQTQLDAKLDPVDIAAMAETDAQNTFTQGQATLESALTYSANVTPDAQASNAFRLIATGDFNLQIPTNGIAGQVLTIFIQQDGTGSRLMTLVGYYGNTTDDLNLSTGANVVDLLTLIYGGSDSRWYVANLKKDVNNAL
jgi:hypothetical protein